MVQLFRRSKEFSSGKALALQLFSFRVCNKHSALEILRRLVVRANVSLEQHIIHVVSSLQTLFLFLGY
jgi:hypothetical protein